MPIKRSSEQKRQTLYEFYSEWASSENKSSSDIGNSMLSVIDLINKTFLETEIIGLTSHAHLLFCSEDKYESNWFLTIIANGTEYYIEYVIPKEHRPWNNATIKGETKTINEFIGYIIIAMFESQGWKDSLELKRLYLEIKDKNESANFYNVNKKF